MTFTIALVLVLLIAVVVLVLVAIADWQQTHRLVRPGHGPANHRSAIPMGV